MCFPVHTHLAVYNFPVHLASLSSSMAEEQSLLSEPLLPAQTQTTADDATAISTFSLIAAVLWIFSIAALSIWAEVETSSSSAFALKIINDAKFTSAGHRFDLAYISTDEATRILLNASDFAHNFLFPDDHRVRVRHVTLRVVAAARSDKTAVDGADGRFRVTLSADSVMENSDVDYALKSALLRAMARVWLYAGGQSTAPPWMMDGMAEYVRVSAGFGTGKECDGVDDGMTKLPADSRGRWRNDHRACAVAQYLGNCEARNNGYIRRLNQALRDPSVDPTVGDSCSIRHIMKRRRRDGDMEPIGSNILATNS